MMEARISVALATIIMLACVSGVMAGDDEVTAKKPLIGTLFTIDRQSPEVITGVVGAADVLRVGLDPVDPEVAIPAEAMSLNSPFDDLDALSFGVWPGCTQTRFVLLFSVDRAALGETPPDPDMIARGFPFNMQDQAEKAQAAGDAFMTLLLYTRLGYIPPDRGSASNNNNLVVNHGDAGGVDFQLSPKDVSPSGGRMNGDLSNLNGASGTQTSSGYDKRGPAPASILYSLAAGSPSLTTLPGTGSPADIYVDRFTQAEGGEELYLSPVEIGLLPGDDIDSMIIIDHDDYMFFDAGVDQIIFTLAPGSPSLMGEFGPADIFSSSGNGIFALFCPAAAIGLGRYDNINMLDFVPCTDAVDCADEWAIGYQCVGDLDHDGDVDLADLAALLSSYGLYAGEVGFLPEADLDFNGHIDLADLATLLANYGDFCW